MRRASRSHHRAVLGAALFLAGILVAGFSATAFAQAAAGSISVSSGQVQIQRTGATIGASSGVGVNVGDRVSTGPNGHAVILLNDQSRLELGPNSSITIDQVTGGAAAAGTRVSLFSGVLRSLVNAAAGGAAANYQVHTPNAVAAVRGTRFDTAYSEGAVRSGYEGCEKYTDVVTYVGTVNLAPNGNPGAGQDVPAGYESTLPCNQPPTTPGPLGMTGATSLESATSGAAGGFVGLTPGAGGAPPPACPVCAGNSLTTGTGTGGIPK
ncbi:MAG TPA: FecR family protein [Candidatus Acidoferrales bacterium]|nr:FecR family protein [Candidatus Acidoferrales bacterium]